MIMKWLWLTYTDTHRQTETAFDRPFY